MQEFRQLSSSRKRINIIPENVFKEKSASNKKNEKEVPAPADRFQVSLPSGISIDYRDPGDENRRAAGGERQDEELADSGGGD